MLSDEETPLEIIFSPIWTSLCPLVTYRKPYSENNIVASISMSKLNIGP
jgi:hypothetical protein